MRRLSRTILLALLVGLLAITQAPPAAAIGSFGPVQEATRPGCVPIDGLMETHGDAVGGADGAIHGFVSFNGSADCEMSDIWYVERRNGRWTRQLSPYKGEVLAVAYDSTGTYLLHRVWSSNTVRVTKRSSAGVFTGGREISANAGSAVIAGDLIASGGTWWAVWAERTSPEPDIVYDLFQAKTIGPDVPTKQNITNTPTVSEFAPSVILRPQNRTSMAFELTNPGSGVTLGIGTAASEGRWALRRFELTPAGGAQPQMAFAGTVTHIVWARGTQIVTANDRGGWRTTKVFNTRGSGPRVAFSRSKVFEAWTTTPDPTRAFAAERSTAAGAAWTGVTISPAGSANHRVLAVAGFGAKATVLIWDGTRVYSRTQN
jgi:hypothetical protein